MPQWGWLLHSARVKEPLVDHRGALQSGGLAEWWNASAGSASGFWKQDVTVLLLTSVVGIVLCYASQGFCSIIGAQFITSLCGGVCALTAEHPALTLRIALGFVICIYSGNIVLFDVRLCVWTCKKCPRVLKWIVLFALGHVSCPVYCHASSFSAPPLTPVLWCRCRCCCRAPLLLLYFFFALHTDVLRTPVGKAGFFPNYLINIWAHAYRE